MRTCLIMRMRMEVSVRKNHCIKRLLCLGFSLAFASCTLLSIDEPRASSWPQDLQVYFTEPGISPRTGVDRHIAERIGDFIRSAKVSVDINIYELSEPAIYEPLIEMHKRGVKVRMVGDGDNVHYAGYQALIKANVPMNIAPSSHIMHNKFVIVDGERLTMGSMNYTPNARNNNENVLFINHEGIAKYYTKEMDLMFSGLRGLAKTNFIGQDDNWFWLDDGSRVEVYFSPHIGGAGTGPEKAANTKLRQIQLIDAAQETIHFAIFSFTDRETVAALERAAMGGVKVYGVFDAGWHESNAYAMHQRLTDTSGEVRRNTANDGEINVRMDGNDNIDPKNPYHGSKIHNKLMVFDADGDNPVVQTGSLNFSPAAAIEGNDENTLFIHNRAIAQRYRDEIMKMYNRGRHLTQNSGGDTAELHDVVIDEINFAGSQSDGGTINEADKFVALRNRTDRPINISGWLLFGVKMYFYRILGHIFPQNTVIPPYGYHIVGYAEERSAYTWEDTASVSWSPCEYIQEMPTAYSTYTFYFNPTQYSYPSRYSEPGNTASSPNYLYLRLRDAEQNTIDVAQRRTTSQGANSSGSPFVSMKRIGENGTAEGSWANISGNGNNEVVKEGYRQNTRVSPGRAAQGSGF